MQPLRSAAQSVSAALIFALEVRHGDVVIDVRERLDHLVARRGGFVRQLGRDVVFDHLRAERLGVVAERAHLTRSTWPSKRSSAPMEVQRHGLQPRRSSIISST